MPVGQIKDFTFQQYLDRLRSASEVRLLDVSPGTSADHLFFNPQGYPNGRLCFDFSTVPIDPEISALFDLDPWRQQLLVVGIAQHRHADKEQLQQSLVLLKKRYPDAIYRKIFVFGVPDDASAADYDIKGVTTITSSSFASLERAMADLASEILYEMSVYAINRKLGSFKSPALKALDQTNVSLAAAKDFRGHHARKSSLGLTKDGTFSTGLTERLKSRQLGRTKKFMGSFYLMAGRLPDALTEFAEAAQILKQSYDHLWFASTLEQIGVCLLLQQFSEVPVTIPSIAKVTVDADSAGKTAKLAAKSAADAAAAAKLATSRLESPRRGASSQDHLDNEMVAEALQTGRSALATFLPLLMDTVLRFFNRRSPESEEMVPQVVYVESSLRFASLLTALRLGGGWNSASLSAIVRNTPQEKNFSPVGPSVMTIEIWCAHTLSPSLEVLPIATTCRFMSALAKLYWRLGLKRKWSFVIRQLIQRLENEFHENDSEATTVLNGLHPSFLKYVLDTIVVVFDWNTLKIEFLRNFYKLCNRPNYRSVAVKAAWQLLSCGVEVLSASEQAQLYHLIRSERDSAPGQYWDPLLLRDITIKPSSGVLSSTTTNGTASNRSSIVGPPDIIYNPFESQNKLEKMVTIVAGERCIINVRLQNPFQFPLDIFELAVVDEEGNKVCSVDQALTLSPNRVSTIPVTFVPREAGVLTVGGIYAHVGGCSGGLFWLRDRLATLFVSRQKQELETPEWPTHTIKARINEGRPSLVLCENSLPKGWAMLLEGERIPFKAEVQNVSTTDAHIASFGFTDSTVEPLKQAIAAPDATRADIYEYEYFLHKRRAVELISQTSKIASGEVAEFEFTLYGKRGINSAAVLLDYGAGEDYTRRLRIPLNITVFPSVELERVDVLAVGLPGDEPELTIVLDLRNAWRESFEVTLWTKDSSDNEVASVTQTIDSQKSSRFLLPLKWNGVSAEKLAQPIPSLSSRQFVVDSKTTQEQIQSFWLREELLKYIGGTWRLSADGELRSGQVELRGLQLSKKMVAVLRTEPLVIQMEVTTPAPLTIESRAVIRTKIVNKTSKKKYGMLRFIPNDTHNILWAGNLQQPVSIEPESEQSVDLEFLPLAWGSYEWTAIYDVIGGGQALLKTPLLLEVPSIK